MDDRRGGLLIRPYTDGEICFVAKDICDILEISNSRDAISTLSEKMKLTLQGKESLVGITDDPKLFLVGLSIKKQLMKKVLI